MAAIGVQVATEFGDPTASNWFVAAWILCITVMFTIAGANTDLLGRRWFLIIGQVICTIGHFITASAHSNTQIIVGMSIEGLGAALCQMAAFALPELLPNKWRHIGVVLADRKCYLSQTKSPHGRAFVFLPKNQTTPEASCVVHANTSCVPFRMSCHCPYLS